MAKPTTQPPRQSQRTRGRPSGRGPGATGPDLRERLLDAAVARFAVRGIAATSLRRRASNSASLS